MTDYEHMKMQKLQHQARYQAKEIECLNVEISNLKNKLKLHKSQQEEIYYLNVEIKSLENKLKMMEKTTMKQSYIYYCENCESLLLEDEIEHTKIADEIRHPNDLAREAEYSDIPLCSKCQYDYLIPVEKHYLSFVSQEDEENGYLMIDGEKAELFFDERKSQYYYYKAVDDES